MSLTPPQKIASIVGAVGLVTGMVGCADMSGRQAEVELPAPATEPVPADAATVVVNTADVIASPSPTPPSVEMPNQLVPRRPDTISTALIESGLISESPYQAFNIGAQGTFGIEPNFFGIPLSKEGFDTLAQANVIVGVKERGDQPEAWVVYNHFWRIVYTPDGSPAFEIGDANDRVTLSLGSARGLGREELRTIAGKVRALNTNTLNLYLSEGGGFIVDPQTEDKYEFSFDPDKVEITTSTDKIQSPTARYSEQFPTEDFIPLSTALETTQVKTSPLLAGLSDEALQLLIYNGVAVATSGEDVVDGLVFAPNTVLLTQTFNKPTNATVTLHDSNYGEVSFSFKLPDGTRLPINGIPSNLNNTVLYLGTSGGTLYFPETDELIRFGVEPATIRPHSRYIGGSARQSRGASKTRGMVSRNTNPRRAAQIARNHDQPAEEVELPDADHLFLPVVDPTVFGA